MTSISIAASQRAITNKLTRKIVDFLLAHKIYAWREDTTGVPGTTMRPSNKTGKPDIFGCMPGGIFLGIEVKTGRDRVSPVQAGFNETVRALGGFCIIVSDWESFISQWNLWNQRHPPQN